MEIARIFEEKSQNKIYGLMGNINLSTNDFKYQIITEYRFKGTVKEFLASKKDKAALKMVMLNEDYLEKKVYDLSDSEIKSIALAKALIDNKEYLVLEFFEKGLNYSEKENYKRLIKKLTKEYNKTVVLFSNDITFMWDFIDELVYVDDEENINTFEKKDIFRVLEIIDKPDISKCIDLIRKKRFKIDNYKSTSDLLKAIYRIKG